MFEIVLHQPEIPPNTGNIMRLAANTGARLHLIRPLGFQVSERQLARAGMDYRDDVDVRIYDNWRACLEHLGNARMFALSTRGATRHDMARFLAGDALVFGSEGRGLPQDLLDAFAPERRLRIPMLGGSRSLNLANAVAVVLYEAWRQCDFFGGA